MLQANRDECLRRRFFKTTLAQVNGRKSNMRFGTIAIDFERPLKSSHGIVEPLATQIRFTQSQMEVGQPWLCLLRAKQTRKSILRFAVRQFHRTHEPVRPSTWCSLRLRVRLHRRLILLA